MPACRRRLAQPRCYALPVWRSLLTTHSQQILDIQQFRANGIEPTQMSLIGLKSMQHFRAAYEPIADEIFVCDSGALASPDLGRLEYRRVRRPIHPFDD